MQCKQQKQKQVEKGLLFFTSKKIHYLHLIQNIIKTQKNGAFAPFLLTTIY